MPKKFPPEFKRDVVAVARRGDLRIPEVAVDFGIAEETVRRWMRQADIDDGIKDGLTTAEQEEVVRLRRANRRLEMENEIVFWVEHTYNNRRRRPRARQAHSCPVRAGVHSKNRRHCSLINETRCQLNRQQTRVAPIWLLTCGGVVGARGLEPPTSAV